MAARNGSKVAHNGAGLGALGDEYNKFPCREGSPRLLKDKTHLPTSPLGIQELFAHQASGTFSRVLCISMPDARLTLGFPRVRSEGEFCYALGICEFSSVQGYFLRFTKPRKPTWDINFVTPHPLFLHVNSNERKKLIWTKIFSLCLIAEFTTPFLQNQASCSFFFMLFLFLWQVK